MSAARREPPIRFGTSGWRGVLGDEVTHARTRALVRATAAWLQDAGAAGGRVLVAHDGRFASDALAGLACAELAAAGLRPAPVAGVAATPLVTHALFRRRFAAGLVFTASHNPPADHGLKVFAARGRPVAAAQAARIEARADAELGRGRLPAPPPYRCARPLDLAAPYRADLLALLDRGALRRAGRDGLVVVYDAMHGAGAGLVDELLRASGVGVERLRARRDPTFGGAPPDPRPERLGKLRRALRRGRGPRLGLANDGDADRLAALDAAGRPLSETDVVALLVDHLARTGRIRRGVAVSLATGSRVERVAAAHGLRVERHPIGFKHFAEPLCSGRVDVAGEESGGFAWRRFGLDKDGVLAGCLLVELVAAAGEGLAARLGRLAREHGPSVCTRRARPTTPALREGLRRLAAAPPSRLGGVPVREVATGDGVRLGFADGFCMWRASGTEAVVRSYAEAPDARALERRLAAGWRVLARAGTIG